jgi:hypothetical protein
MVRSNSSSLSSSMAARLGDAGVVDQDIDRAEPALAALDQPRDLGRA